MSPSKHIYIDPLGNYTSDISYNNVNNFLKNKDTINARIEDEKKKYNSNNMQFIIWSFVASILLLIILVLIKNIQN